MKQRVPLPVIISIVLAGLGLFLGYGYIMTRQELLRLMSPEGQQQVAQQEAAQAIANLKKLAFVPEEQAVVATIIDAELLASQSPFYKGSINGDQLIIFPQSQRAYIYSPSRHILVNAGPLVTQSASSPSPTPSASLSP